MYVCVYVGRAAFAPPPPVPWWGPRRAPPRATSMHAGGGCRGGRSFLISMAQELRRGQAAAELSARGIFLA